ncbi:organic cation transporter protein, partial [Trichonephila clavata]
PWWLGVSLSLFGKFCISCAFGIIYVFTAEIFPTIVRNVGLGSASVSARVGSIIAPFVRELGKATHPVVPQIFFGILAAIGGFLVLFLPETNNCSVPDTFKDMAEISRKGHPEKKRETVVALQEVDKKELTE